VVDAAPPHARRGDGRRLPLRGDAVTPRDYLLSHAAPAELITRALRALGGLVAAAEASPAVLTPADLSAGAVAPLSASLAGIDAEHATAADARRALPAIVRRLHGALLDEAAVQERERRAHAREGRGDEAELARALEGAAQANARAVKVAARVARLWTTEGEGE